MVGTIVAEIVTGVHVQEVIHDQEAHTIVAMTAIHQQSHHLHHHHKKHPKRTIQFQLLTNQTFWIESYTLNLTSSF